MANSKKSIRRTVMEMAPGDKVRISLADMKYASIAPTLYRAKMEGREYRSHLAEDRTAVIVERIS